MHNLDAVNKNTYFFRLESVVIASEGKKSFMLNNIFEDDINCATEKWDLPMGSPLCWIVFAEEFISKGAK